MSEKNILDNKQDTDPLIEAMFKAGFHFGYSKSKRHPTMSDFIFGLKNRIEIFDLTKVVSSFKKAKDFAENLGRTNRQILLISSKGEAEKAIKDSALALDLPYVSGRWLGGTLTNFTQISLRIKRLVDLKSQKEKGELAKYTKKERLMLDREIEKLEEMFGGLLSLKGMPGALLVIDPKHEKTAVSEAKRLKIPIIALMNSDNNVKGIEYFVPGNDSVSSSIEFFVKEISSAYQKGKASVQKSENK